MLSILRQIKVALSDLDAPISCLIHALAPNSAYEEDVGGQAMLCGRLRLITLIVYAYALYGDAQRVIN